MVLLIQNWTGSWWHRVLSIELWEVIGMSVFMTLDWIRYDIENRATYLKGREILLIFISFVCYLSDTHFHSFFFHLSLFFIFVSLKSLFWSFSFFIFFIFCIFILFWFCILFSISLKMKAFLVTMVRLGVFVTLRIREL